MDMELNVDMDAIEDIMWSEDDVFEKAVKDLDLRSILKLMEALQSAMKKEQLHFEELTLQLQKYPDRNSYNHRKISAALCSTQRLLTNLCTKHMMCSGQRSLRSSFSENCPTVESAAVVQINTMSSSAFQNGGDRTSGFRESLRFFQSQVEKSNVPHNNEPILPQKSQISNAVLANGSAFSNKTNTKLPNSIPSVDNILSKVKTLCATRNGKIVSDSTSSFPTVHRNTSENTTQATVVPTIYQTSSSYNGGGITRSEQVSSNDKTLPSDRPKRPSLLSNFNPTFDPEENKEQINKTNHLSNTSNIETLNSHQYVISESKTTSLKNKSVECVTNDFKQKLIFENVDVTSCLKNITKYSDEKTSVINNSVETDKTKKVSEDNSVNISTNRTFGQYKEKLSQIEHNKTTADIVELNLPDSEKLKAKDQDLEVEDVSKKDDDESISEKHSDSLESDYDSQDFVVHKANFSEDFLEAMSEDNYSSVNEDYEVEHPEEQITSPNIPSPDYPSDEEEYQIQHNEEESYDDVEFIDNSAQYINDPRRYMYYPDDKELEVIPEEDEDDIDDEEMYSNEESYKPGGYQVSNPSSDDSRYNNHGECDSGLTDDQRSSSSIAEECELEDDTDSAKGSLPLQDSSSESPTYNDRANMFQNVEYHKTKKKNTSHKRIIEDYEKPKVNGKNVETISVIHQNGEDDEIRQARNLTSSWDPHELLKVLYRLDFPTEPVKRHTRYVNKEGYLEKLPSGRKKATYWNPWKTKYIKLKDGFLYCYDNIRSEKPSMTLQLMGGHIDSLENKMIGIDDQKGHYVVIRCSDEEETEVWEAALRSHCTEDFINAYTSPSPYPLKINKNIIIIDLGSCSVRAGILMSSPSMPQLFFPTVCATNKQSQKKVFGMEALKPSIRKECHLTFPLHPSAKVTKYSIDVSILPDILKYIFCQLNIQPDNYRIQLSMPRNLSLQTKLKIACILLDDFKVKGINLTHQAILSLHAYNSKSGIIVDIGDRLDVIPIIEGYIVESGVTRLPYGGQRMIHHLKHALAEKNISLVSDVETYLARYILEQLCYVAEDYNDELQRYHTNPDDFEMSISTSHFFKEDNTWDEIILDLGRFHVPEGLFTPEKWGIDNPGLHKLVYHAIQECGVDLRREMSRSIYVSGGLTLLPGFAERLENEVDKLTPNTIIPKVHASPYRYHMSYIGACQIALSEKFDDICITKQIWRKEGNTCVKKWHI